MILTQENDDSVKISKKSDFNSLAKRTDIGFKFTLIIRIILSKMKLYKLIQSQFVFKAAKLRFDFQ